ncbi:Sec1-like protein [Zopfochytrium polystomum]|nr:Sec1-like protein [Zopfochytrium polystomum]
MVVSGAVPGAAGPSAGAAPAFSSAIKDHARRELVNVLDSEHGVEKIFHLSADRPETESKNLIYICRPKIAFVKFIAGHVRQKNQFSSKTEYSIFFVPRRTLVCERVLEEEGVYGDVSISEFHLDLVPLDDDVWSLELDDAFRELYLDGDTSAIYYVAKAMMKLQSMFGVIPSIIGKGRCAKLLSDLMVRMKRELALNMEAGSTDQVFPLRSDLDSVIIVDRTVDLISPMCSQLTYEGLIDDIYGIKSTFVELESSIVGPPPNAPANNRPRKIPLNGTERLYAQLRDLNFAVVGSVLNQNARRIQEEIESRNQARTVTQLKDFIGKLGGIEAERAALKLRGMTLNKMLTVQQNLIAGNVPSSYLDYFEELIAKQAPLMQVLRLLCLYSMTTGGLKQPKYDFSSPRAGSGLLLFAIFALYLIVVQTYGVEHILTLQNLASLNMFRTLDTSKSTFSQSRQQLRLAVDDVDEQKPNDISYVYSGFAPILVRLVQAATLKTTSALTTAAASPATGAAAGSSLQPERTSTSSGPPSWKGFEEALKVLPGGPAFEESQKLPDEGLLAKRNANAPKVTLVLFLGGCTFSEISSLRFLSRKGEGNGREFITVTTNMTNGNSLLASLQEKLNIAPLQISE